MKIAVKLPVKHPVRFLHFHPLRKPRPHNPHFLPRITGYTTAALLLFAIFVARSRGLTTFDPNLISGSFLTHDTGSVASAVGALMHLFFGALFGLAYSLVFQLLRAPTACWD